jgi:CHAT domain-containing protein
VQVLKEQGQYYQARQILAAINQTLQSQPDSILKALALTEFGSLLQLIGNLDRAQELLEISLAVAENVNAPSQKSAALMALGNVARSRYEQAEGDAATQPLEQALNYYRQAAETAVSPIVPLQAQVNQFELAMQAERLELARSLSANIQQTLQSLSPSRPLLYAQIRFASLLPQNQTAQARALLQDAADQAEALGDVRSQSYAVGELGAILENRNQLGEALDFTQQALLLAQSLQAPDVEYQWQWQLGRLLNRQGNLEGAIAAYAQAVQNLQALRGDLIAVNKDARFSFREEVEPVYRNYVDLLLKSAQEDPNRKQAQLTKARDAMEALRLAELVNFLRIDCEVSEVAAIDKIDPQAAVIYPILLADRLEIIISVAGQPLENYTIPVSREEVENTARLFQENLFLPGIFPQSAAFLPLSQQLYDWLLAPLKTDLVTNDVETLVFVLDGALSNIPMSALHNGEDYLIENYAIALSPSLRLTSPQPLGARSLQALVVGLSEARQGFSALPAVKEEVETIEGQLPSTVLLNDRFQEATLESTLQQTSFPVVHLATHGQFSSNAEETFILTWEDRITIDELPQLLQKARARENQPIELLILSACETVTGDDRAALGLAGVAIRAGARSTVGTLWKVSDVGTAKLMSEFYQQLEKDNITKAEALRQSQLSLLAQEQLSHPYYWSAFVILGNWL